jgi:putative ABC transport system permease protein
VLTDIRFAFRMLVKTPGFAAIAIVTLALGIGANTAIFSLIHDLFLRGLPFHEPSRIVRIYGEANFSGASSGYFASIRVIRGLIR